MDWFLERGDVRAIGELRRQIANHLRRHAAAPADVDAAEIVVQELIANAIKHSNGPAWVSLDWTDTHPRLSV